MAKEKKPQPKKNPGVIIRARCRPTKYLPEYCEKLIAHGKEGRSLKAFAAEVCVNMDTVYNWIKLFPDFSEAYQQFKVLAEHWWEKTGQEHLMSRGPFNTDLYKFMAKVRFRWTEPQEVKIDSGDEQKLRGEIDKLKEQLKASLSEQT